MFKVWRLGVSLKHDSQDSPPRNKNVAGSVPSYLTSHTARVLILAFAMKRIF